MILIKVGGGKNINWDFIAEDLVGLVKTGEKIVLVHGASGRRDDLANQLHYPTRTVISPSGVSSVYTDQKALEIFLMVYAGLMNKEIVAKLRQRGLNTVGLSGVDGALWQGKRKKELMIQENSKTKLLRNNYSGRVDKINASLLHLLLEHDYIPVLCPPALSDENEIINTDNDWAVAQTAAALGIKILVILFEAPGLLKNINDEKSVIPQINKKDLLQYLPYAQGRMKKKLLGAQKALELGITKVYWGDGRIKNPLSNLLSGQGTIISA